MDIAESIIRYLAEDSMPTDELGIRRHIETSKAIDFFRATFVDHVPIHVLTPEMFATSVTVERRPLTDDDRRELLEWSMPPVTSWSYSVSDDQVSTYPPLDDLGSHILNTASPLFFQRTFEADDDPEYFEIAERVKQLLDIHWVETRNAFCTLDSIGNLVEVFTAYRNNGATILTFHQDYLDAYLFATQRNLVRLFDAEVLTRPQTAVKIDRGWLLNPAELDFSARWVALEGHDNASIGYLRGAHIYHGNEDPQRASNYFLYGVFDTDNYSYPEFQALNLETGTIAITTAQRPDYQNRLTSTGDSIHPLSPLFFDPEVVLRYKFNPDRYEIDQFSVSCKGAWHLRSYGVNDAGQIFVYLKDFVSLPAYEQQFWKLHNEPPRGTPIPANRVAMDFKGEWPEEFDDLSILRDCLENFPKATHSGTKIAIWRPPDNMRQLYEINYVYTESGAEWGEELLKLCKLIIDGLSPRPLRKLARSVGHEDSQELGSIAALDYYLNASGVDDTVAKAIYQPMRQLQGDRTKYRAHRGPTTSRTHIDYRAHYREMTSQLQVAVNALAELIEKGQLDIA